MRLFKYSDSRPGIAQVMADRGLYFTASNPTPGTGLATIAALASLADVSPFISIVAGAVPLALDFLRLTCTGAGTGGTAIRFAIKTDDAKADPTGGTQLTPMNANHGDPYAGSTGLKIFAGPLIAGAAVAPRLLHHSLLRPIIPVVGDEYVINFGATEPAPIAATARAGVAISDITMPAPPVIIQPGKICQLHIWLPGQTVAGAYEVDLRFFEYPTPNK